MHLLNGIFLFQYFKHFSSHIYAGNVHTGQSAENRFQF